MQTHQDAKVLTQEVSIHDANQNHFQSTNDKDKALHFTAGYSLEIVLSLFKYIPDTPAGLKIG